MLAFLFLKFRLLILLLRLDKQGWSNFSRSRFFFRFAALRRFLPIFNEIGSSIAVNDFFIIRIISIRVAFNIIAGDAAAAVVVVVIRIIAGTTAQGRERIKIVPKNLLILKSRKRFLVCVAVERFLGRRRRRVFGIIGLIVVVSLETAAAAAAAGAEAEAGIV